MVDSKVAALETAIPVVAGPKESSVGRGLVPRFPVGRLVPVGDSDGAVVVLMSLEIAAEGDAGGPLSSLF
mgnify:CR=1 FL=1